MTEKQATTDLIQSLESLQRYEVGVDGEWYRRWGKSCCIYSGVDDKGDWVKWEDVAELIEQSKRGEE